RLGRRNTDFHDDLPSIPYLRRISLFVAPDEEGCVRGGAEERARVVDTGQEGRHVALQLEPELHIIGLEYGPLSAQSNALTHEVEEPAYVEVTPFGIAGERSCAPDADAAAGECANAVN